MRIKFVKTCPNRSDLSRKIGFVKILSKKFVKQVDEDGTANTSRTGGWVLDIYNVGVFISRGFSTVGI